MKTSSVPKAIIAIPDPVLCQCAETAWKQAHILLNCIDEHKASLGSKAISSSSSYSSGSVPLSSRSGANDSYSQKRPPAEDLHELLQGHPVLCKGLTAIDALCHLGLSDDNWSSERQELLEAWLGWPFSEMWVHIEGHPETLRRQVDDLIRRLTTAPMAALSPAAKAAAAGDTPVEYLGGGICRVGAERIRLSDVEEMVLEALVEAGAASKDELVRKSGVPDAVRVLKHIRTTYPALKESIRLPGSKGRGGYSTTIQATDR